jgi:hypothetical protein
MDGGNNGTKDERRWLSPRANIKEKNGKSKL